MFFFASPGCVALEMVDHFLDLCDLLAKVRALRVELSLDHIEGFYGQPCECSGIVESSTHRWVFTVCQAFVQGVPGGAVGDRNVVTTHGVKHIAELFSTLTGFERLKASLRRELRVAIGGSSDATGCTEVELWQVSGLLERMANKAVSLSVFGRAYLEPAGHTVQKSDVLHSECDVVGDDGMANGEDALQITKWLGSVGATNARPGWKRIAKLYAEKCAETGWVPRNCGALRAYFARHKHVLGRKKKPKKKA
jgi:hypothetical protein